MTTPILSWRSVRVALGLLVVGAGAHGVQAQPGYPTSSSEWGPGYGAAAAVDAIADENSNYWQTVQGGDKGAWWQLNLGQVFSVKGVKIAWARCEDKYHCPPASATVQVSLTGEEGAWKDVRRIVDNEIPRDEQPYESEREWSYPLPEAAPARYVRLLFSDGDQPGAKYDGYLCLGEVEVQAPGLTPQVVTIEAPFGKAEVNVTFPALARLYLRGPNGLHAQSLLAQAGRRPWAKGGCTYVVGEDKKRYESRLARPDSAELTEEDGRPVLRITGIKLSPGGDEPPVATEDWTLSAPGDGSQLIWKIVRRWEKDFVSIMSGSPGLFFCFDARHRENSVTSTIWCDPFRMAARPSDLYALVNYPRRVSQNHIQTIRDRDTWTIYKLWTNWHAPSDLRLEVEGGHLYRRGSFAWLSEAGAVTAGDITTTHTKGQVEEISLKIGGVDKHATGYQLAVTLPDKETEASLKDFYVSVLNGGAVNDQKGFDFGNESDGWYYAGSSWMYGMAVAAGTPAPGQLSSHPYDVARAFREHLAHILTRLDDEGRAHFGYNQGGQWVDDNLHTIIGTRAYLLHSGDLHFVRQNLPALERMLAYFIQRRNE
ncbi:MAG: discoidin domain-containing protein, partial [Planctomycetota bacterium]